MIYTVRIACANVESELAARVGAHLRKPTEAKRVLRNLFLAPGRVRVGTSTIAVDLAPATTTTEHDALSALLAEVPRIRYQTCQHATFRGNSVTGAHREVPPVTPRCYAWWRS